MFLDKQGQKRTQLQGSRKRHAHLFILYLRKTIESQICLRPSQDQHDMQPRLRARQADESPTRRRSQTEVAGSSRDADALSQFGSCSFHGLNLQVRYVTFSPNKAVSEQDRAKIRRDEIGLKQFQIALIQKRLKYPQIRIKNLLR